MARQVRSDKTVGNAEKDLGLSTGAIRNKDGRDTRSDKQIGTIRKEQGKEVDRPGTGGTCPIETRFGAADFPKRWRPGFRTVSRSHQGGVQ